jgi:hypothetical protein
MTARASWTAYAAAAWALIFAVLHVVWASGWYVGLNQELARGAFQQRWFLIYDIVVAGLCAVAAWVALALVRPWGMRLPRLLVGGLAWCGSAVLVLRAGAGATQTLYVAVTGRNVLGVDRLWEVWFCLGAFLFGLSTWRYWRTSQGRRPPAGRRNR